MRLVEAAGGIPWRIVEGRLQVLIVYRDRYADWSFPKGKLDEGESHEQAAVREVEEETGLLCSLGGELPEVRYVVTKPRKSGGGTKSRSKRVRYWSMEPVSPDAGLSPEDPDEISAVEWVEATAAPERLTHSADRALLRSLQTCME